MTIEHWVTAAMTDDAMVAELLLRMKQSSSLDLSQAPTTSMLPPISWGHRKSRSKPSSTAAAVRKEQQSGSPTTPLCWSGGGDCYDESSRPSDLSSGGRSTKGGMGNEGATTSNYKKSRKRKSFAELKEEEDFLLKERLHLNRELEMMRVTMNKQIATSHDLKKFKIDLHQNHEEVKKKTSTLLEDKSSLQMRMTYMAQSSCVANQETKARETGFVLPDLNMIPDQI